MAAEGHRSDGAGLLADLARRWWGVELRVADAEGIVAELGGDGAPAPRNEFCRRSLAAPEGLRRCAGSLAFLCGRARAGAPGQVVSHPCHLGFTLLGTAVTERPADGTLVVCGARPVPPSRNELEQLRARLLEVLPPGAQPEMPPPAPEPIGADEDRLAEIVRSAAADLARDASDGRAPDRPARPRAPRRAVEGPPPLVGHSLPLLEVRRLVERIAASEATVLVQGESGTGKELVARQIHHFGRRRDRPFVAQNCSALNDNLLESALFGHVRGSFTGAARDARGLFDTADGGTLFLDEIGDMSPALQVKLLRVLQEGTFTPVGSAEERRADVRIVAATHRDLAALVQAGSFRDDLFYRVNVIRLVVPPLRERSEDVPVLVTHFLRRFARAGRTPVLAPETLRMLLDHAWPGNVRELQNEIERMCVLAGDAEQLGPELVSPRIAAATAARPAAPVFSGPRLPRLHEAVEELERGLIGESLRRNGGNRSKVARELGIARSNLVLKIARYGLE